MARERIMPSFTVSRPRTSALSKKDSSSTPCCGCFFFSQASPTIEKSPSVRFDLESPLEKQFFYHFDPAGLLVNDPFIVRYKIVLPIEKGDFSELLHELIVPEKRCSREHGFDFYMPENSPFINGVYCFDTLELPIQFDEYALTGIGVAVNYSASRAKASGRISITFEDAFKNQIEINIRIAYLERKTQNYASQLKNLLSSAIRELRAEKNKLCGLDPSARFSELGYVVTDGRSEEEAYKEAYATSLPSEVKLVL
jgi:hypothetical protein